MPGGLTGRVNRLCGVLWWLGRHLSQKNPDGGDYTERDRSGLPSGSEILATCSAIGSLTSGCA